MHAYTIENHPKEKIIFSLAIISVFITPIITNYLNLNPYNFQWKVRTILVP